MRLRLDKFTIFENNVHYFSRMLSDTELSSSPDKTKNHQPVRKRQHCGGGEEPITTPSQHTTTGRGENTARVQSTSKVRDRVKLTEEREADH